MNATERTINDAKTGDIVTLVGTPWRVIGYTDRPTALLERVGCEQMATNNRTHHSVTLGTPHADQFLLSPTDQGEESNLHKTQFAPAADAQGEAGIEWGPPIEVNGKRPEWLVDGEIVTGRDYGSSNDWGVEWWPTEVEWGSAQIIYLRADHPHYQQQTDWTPCERTVRYILDVVLPNPENMTADRIRAHTVRESRTALESLLPKQPDPAEELVIGLEADGLVFTPEAREDFKSILSRLVSKEKLA